MVGDWQPTLPWRKVSQLDCLRSDYSIDSVTKAKTSRVMLCKLLLHLSLGGLEHPATQIPESTLAGFLDARSPLDENQTQTLQTFHGQSWPRLYHLTRPQWPTADSPWLTEDTLKSNKDKTRIQMSLAFSLSKIQRRYNASDSLRSTSI